MVALLGADPEAASTAASTAAKAETTKKAARCPLHEHPTILKMLKENNRVRAEYGLAAQKINAELTKACQDHANYMARTGDYNHGGNGGMMNRAWRYNYKGAVGGEILHAGPLTIGGAFQGWIWSPSHRAILLGRTTEAGFGYAVSANGTPYWVGLYGDSPTSTE
jgi:uncharacterized protein YkwD